MVVYSEPFDKKILLELQTHYFGDMVKGVVDVNIRPRQGNRSRGVEDPGIRNTIEAQRGKHSLKEFLRMREIICDYYLGDNFYQSNGERIQRDFDMFMPGTR